MAIMSVIYIFEQVKIFIKDINTFNVTSFKKDEGKLI